MCVYVCIILGLPNTSGKNGIIYNFWLGTFTLLGGSKSGRKTDPTGTERSMAQWPCNRNRFIGGTYHLQDRFLQGYVREYPQKIWPEIWYVYVPPSVGSWNSH